MSVREETLQEKKNAFNLFLELRRHSTAWFSSPHSHVYTVTCTLLMCSPESTNDNEKIGDHVYVGIDVKRSSGESVEKYETQRETFNVSISLAVTWSIAPPVLDVSNDQWEG